MSDCQDLWECICIIQSIIFFSRCETSVSEHHKMIHVHRKKGQDFIFSQSLMEHISFGMTRYAFRMYV